jgi:hypothetical protein
MHFVTGNKAARAGTLNASLPRRDRPRPESGAEGFGGLIRPLAPLLDLWLREASMAYVLKTNQTGSGQNIPIPESRTFAALDGERIYVWMSETVGGPGLYARGHVRLGAADEPATCVVEDSLSCPVLGKAQLQFYREHVGLHPMAVLSRNLYFHAHQKVARIDQATADFLESYFAS